jgi:hypothetical protein
MIPPATVSTLTAFYVGWAVLGAALVAGLIAMLRAGSTADLGEPPQIWGLTGDDRRWDDEALEAVHTSLRDVRAAATAWGATVGTLLGAFGLVAFIKGPDTFTDVKGSAADAAALLVLGAAVLASVAVLLAALAAQGVPKAVQGLNGWAFWRLTTDRARTAATQLAISRGLTLVAAYLVLGSIGIVWFTTLKDRGDTRSSSAIVLPDRAGAAAVCGTLGVEGGQLTVAPAHGARRVVRGEATLTLVDSCP